MILSLVYWNWWLPVGTYTCLALVAILAFRRTKKWPFLVFFLASCFVLLRSILFVCARILLMAAELQGSVHSHPSDPAQADRYAALTLQASQVYLPVRLAQICAGLSKITYQLAFPLAAIAAVGIVIKLLKNSSQRSFAGDQSVSIPETTRNWRTLFRRANLLPITACACVCVAIVLRLVAKSLGFRPTLFYPHLLLEFPLLVTLGLIGIAVLSSVLTIVGRRKRLWVIIAGLTIVALGCVLIGGKVDMGLGAFLVVTAAICGLATSVALIIRDRTWLALGVGGILVSLMILFPSPPRFLW